MNVARIVSMIVMTGLAHPVTGAELERYPTKPIRIVVPFTPGGSNDLLGRVLAQKLNEAWGQPMIIDNRPGAGSTIGIELVVRAAPDGYTLLLTSGGVAINVSLYRLPFNPVTDLAPVALLAQMPYLLAVHPSLPAQSTRDLISLAKEQPGKLIFSSSGAGTSSHLTMEMFKSLAKIDLLHVPYKGGGPAVSALAGGEVQMTFNVITGTLPQARAGRIRALAVRRNDSQRSCITKNRGFSLRVKRRLLSTRSPGSLFSIGERVYITPVMRQGSNSSQPLLL